MSDWTTGMQEKQIAICRIVEALAWCLVVALVVVGGLVYLFTEADTHGEDIGLVMMLTGLAVSAAAAAFSVCNTVRRRDELLRQSFEFGREHQRSISAVR